NVLPPFGLAAVVHEDGAAAGATACLDIVQDVADEPAAREVQPEFAGGLEQEAGRGLSAVTSTGVARHGAARVVRAPVAARQARAIDGEHLLQAIGYVGEAIVIEVPQRHSGLVADHHERQLQAAENPQSPRDMGRKLHEARFDVVGNVFQQGTVLVEEHRRTQGHDGSRIGSTISSGMAVSAGCESAKRTALATFAGSCRTPGSMSGKRSSRKGVRMPPATMAVTLMPC